MSLRVSYGWSGRRCASVPCVGCDRGSPRRPGAIGVLAAVLAVTAMSVGFGCTPGSGVVGSGTNGAAASPDALLASVSQAQVARDERVDAVQRWRDLGEDASIVDVSVDRLDAAPIYRDVPTACLHRGLSVVGPMRTNLGNADAVDCYGEDRRVCGSDLCCEPDFDVPESSLLRCYHRLPFAPAYVWMPEAVRLPLRSRAVGSRNVCVVDASGAPFCFLDGPDAAEVAEERFESVATAAPGLACGLRGDGTVRCWGAEAVGALAAPEGTFVDQCVAPFHWCGLTADGRVRCVGEDLYGETRVPEGPIYGALACALEVTCVAEVEGPVRCFGRFADEALRAPSGLQARRLGVSHRHACGVRPDGALECWGELPWVLHPDGRSEPPLMPPAAD